MSCKYAFMVPGFLLIVIHFVVFHPMLKDNYMKIVPYFKGFVRSVLKFFGKNYDNED